MFQLMASVPVSGMANNSQPCIAYLWIPPTCSYVRGVLIAGRNVTEHFLVGHRAIRSACTKADLAYCGCPSFFDYRIKDGNRHGEFLQQILKELAQVSGYYEIAGLPGYRLGNPCICRWWHS